MAAVRPAVLVSREFTPTAAAVETPDLNTVLIGASYHLQDYPADKTDIGVGAYGDPTSDSDGVTNGRPIPGSDVIVVADPPNNVTSAVLDSSSVKVFFDDVLAEVSTGVDGNKGASPDENLFYTTDTNVDFMADGVRPGDRLVISDDSGASTNTVVKTVQEVGGWAGSTLNSYELKCFTNLVDAGLTAPGNGSYKFRIERALDDVEIGSSWFVVSGNTITIKGGVTISTDLDGDGTDETGVFVNSASAYIEYASLRQDLAVLDSVENTAAIESTLGRIDERNPLATAMDIALKNTTTPIYYYGVTGDDLNGASDSATAHQSAIDALESRKDMYAMVPLTTEISIIQAYRTAVLALAQPEISNFRTVIGAQKELPSLQAVTSDSATGDAEIIASDIVDVFVVASPGGFDSTGVQFDDELHIIDGNTTDDQHDVSSVIDARRLVLQAAATGVASDTKRYYIARPNPGTLALLGDDCKIYLDGADNKVRVPSANLANTDYVGHLIDITNSAGDDGRYMVISGTDGVKAFLDYDGQGLIYTARQAGVAGGAITIEYATGTALAVAVVGTAITITLDTGVTTSAEIQAAVEAHSVANGLVTISGSGTDPAVVAAAAALSTGSAGVDTFYVVMGEGNTFPGVEETDVTAIVKSTLISSPALITYTLRKPYRQLLDNSAAFLSGATAVVVGDLVQIPVDGAGVPGAGANDYDSATVDGIVGTVVSDNRLQLAAGGDILTENPLLDATQAIPHYRVGRSLTKDGQIENLNAITAALDHEQILMVWPAEVTLNGTKNENTGVQSRTPGYYLAAGVGGMSAGLPSQQGFTNLSLVGFDQLHDSNFYFSHSQIDELSNGGHYVFVQDTPTSPPYSVHQLTTDTTSLETGEFSMVRNYHFVAQTYKNALDDFLGNYNVIPETIQLLENVMESVGTTLKRQRLPRIGAPIRSAVVQLVQAIEGTKDQVEIVVEVDFPAPLNRIELRIVG